MLLAVVNWESYPSSISHNYPSSVFGAGREESRSWWAAVEYTQILSFWLLVLMPRDGALGVVKGMTSCTLDVTCVCPGTQLIVPSF